MKWDLHIHSRYSRDSQSRIPDILAKAARMGLSGIAVTDHDSMKSYSELKPELGLQVIRGMEISTDKGDLIGLFLQEEIRTRVFDEAVEWIAAQDGISVLPHPFRAHKDVEAIGRKVDAIEVFNAETGPASNAKARELAVCLGKTMVAGSDAHTIGYIGCCYTIIDEPLRANLKNGKTEVIEGYPPAHSRMARKVNKIYASPIEKKLHYLKHPIKGIRKLL